MSISVFNSVRKAMRGQLPTSLGPGPRSLLMILADYVEDGQGAARPPERRLARELGADRRTIQRWLQQLRKLKIVSVQKKSHQQYATRWRINEQVLEQFAQGRHNDASEPAPQGRHNDASDSPGAALCPSRGGIMPPDPLGSLKEERSFEEIGNQDQGGTNGHRISFSQNPKPKTQNPTPSACDVFNANMRARGIERTMDEAEFKTAVQLRTREEVHRDMLMSLRQGRPYVRH